ncbi:MAG: methyltransferase domain-containing protein [Deltaproteobacteria bacterium]|nr:methyltransferase domain-containing protein [Deltaproteobacteria bacterium]
MPQVKIPEVPLIDLTTLWFQVSGTLCNLECEHCFIGCGPNVTNHKMMPREMVRGYLNEAKGYGVREFYLTGGEPLLNRELPGIIEDILRLGDITVLTNATLITPDIASMLQDLSGKAAHTLLFRVSIESHDEEENDSVRGKGSFQRAAGGIKNLIATGFNPIITATKLGEANKSKASEAGFKDWLKGLGAVEPQIKAMPTLYLGRAEESIRPYSDDERVTENCFKEFPKANLQCSYCRMVTAEGVYVCPILIDDPKARLGSTLGESLTAYGMESPACYTCRTAGLCCSNTPSVSDEVKETGEITREDVISYYGKAAEAPQPALCCPTIYERVETGHIPKEALEISYGCGSPVSQAQIGAGETMVDLGSGGGIDCFIAAKLAGPSGRVIGIDMTDEMLKKALENRVKVVENLGYDNVEFRKGVLEEIPVDGEAVDLVISNCVINLSVDKREVFREIYRVLKDGGRFVISDIVSDRAVPIAMQRDKDLWGECLSGALTVEEFIRYAAEAGFYGTTLLSTTLYRKVEGIRFDSITFQGHKFVKGKECLYRGHQAVYNGPFKSVTDDEEHTFPRGVAVEICTDTAAKLRKPPYDAMFTITDPADTPVRQSRSG